MIRSGRLGFRLKKTYLILAHHMPLHLRRLVLALNDGESSFLVHVDKNADINAFTQSIELENLRFIEERHSCAWGDFAIVAATLSLLKSFMTQGDGSEYGILLSGQDYPLASNSRINAFLDAKRGVNFQTVLPINEAWPIGEVTRRLKYYRITLSPEKEDTVYLPHIGSEDIFSDHLLGGLLKLTIDQRFDQVFKHQILKLISNPRKLPNMPMYGGGQWFAFTTDIIFRILTFLKVNEDYIRYHVFTHVPDEIFFHTLLKYFQAIDPSIRIEDSLTYVDWSGSTPAIFDRRHHASLQQVAQSHLFARKFDTAVSGELLDLLDADRQ